MKNLKKLSRKSLKLIKGEGNPYLEESAPEDGYCPDMCTPTGGGTDDGCRQYGLTCGFYPCGNQLVNRCQ